MPAEKTLAGEITRKIIIADTHEVLGHNRKTDSPVAIRVKFSEQGHHAVDLMMTRAVKRDLLEGKADRCVGGFLPGKVQVFVTKGERCHDHATDASRIEHV